MAPTSALLTLSLDAVGAPPARCLPPAPEAAPRLAFSQRRHSSQTRRPAEPPQRLHARPAGAPRLRRLAAGDERRVNPDTAASSFAKGLQAGDDPDDLVARQLGAATAAQLTDVQAAYKAKIKASLAARAEELRREKEARSAKFTAGQAAYARGQYPRSVQLLEGALNEEGPFSQVGGEIQLWLALAYNACGREEECVEVYRVLENTHPAPAIRKQAASLRYIIEAPKLEIDPDERVAIPVLTDLDPNRGSRQPAPRARPAPAPKRPKTWDEEYWTNYQPPVYLANRYVWAAAAAVAAGLALFSSR